MTKKYEIAVVGAGPGGLSAAARAAALGISHVLLEKSSAIAATIQKYQKGKHVMAEPSILPLRSEMPFAQGTREKVLAEWHQSLREHQINIQLGAEVTTIDGVKGDFRIRLSNEEQVLAENVVLGIGVQGNLRTLGLAADDSTFVEYQLDDPDEIQNEMILVVGAGDAAIENAIALSKQNKVTIVNRRDEFTRAKEGNITQIQDAISAGDISCLFDSQPIGISPVDSGSACVVTLSTAEGEVALSADRVIARLGAIPPRGLVESFGVTFPSEDPSSLPVLSTRYESSVPGLYIIGALAGYPLIKQAMNQGYEVIDYIQGKPVQPADHDLLAEKFHVLGVNNSVDEVLAMMQEKIRLFSDVNPLMFRELILDSLVHKPNSGEIIFRKNDYTNSFFAILRGEVLIKLESGEAITSKQGDFFGELSLLSGRRRSATVLAGDNCELVEIPRRCMNKLLNSVPSVKQVLDETFVLRAIQGRFAPELSIAELQPIASSALINEYQAGEAIFNEGDDADALHLIRSGSVSVLKTYAGKELPVSYVSAGNYVGEMGLLGGHKRSATVRASVKTQTISVNTYNFKRLLASNENLKTRLEEVMQSRLQDNLSRQSSEEAAGVLDFLLRQGLGEATDVLLINKSLCINCDNCETACAQTHQGTSRLNRQGGAIFAEVHVPTSCRHCEDPHCMKDCPPDAIQRAPGGEVFIGDNCIGCGNCEQNCPYDVIQMAYPSTEGKGFWRALFFGDAVPKPKSRTATEGETGDTSAAIKKAVKCDMCKDLTGGPACVRACPTGAASRLAPEAFVQTISERHL